MIRPCILLALLLGACASDSSTGLTQADIACPTDSTLTYSNFGSMTVADNCLGCHDRTRPVLSSRVQVQQAKDSVIQAAVLSTSMPQGGGMSTEERKLLGQWLNCGAP
jgi:uncharacterized membrane protein